MPTGIDPGPQFLTSTGICLTYNARKTQLRVIISTCEAMAALQNVCGYD
jgi:hypothetical protein